MVDSENWKLLTAEELNAFLAIFIVMGIKKLPSLDMYWSENNMIGCPWIREIMPRNRFKQINRFLFCMLQTMHWLLRRENLDTIRFSKSNRCLITWREPFLNGIIQRSPCLSMRLWLLSMADLLLNSIFLVLRKRIFFSSLWFQEWRGWRRRRLVSFQKMSREVFSSSAVRVRTCVAQGTLLVRD